MAKDQTNAATGDDLSYELIDLRGPCGYLMARLDPVRAEVIHKCKEGSKKAGRPIFHTFHLRIGRLMDAEERYGKGASG